MKLKHKKLISQLFFNSNLKHLYRFKRLRAIRIDELKVIYVPIPKVANRSVKEALAKKIQLPYKISAHKADWNFIALPQVQQSPYYSFSFVRNPLDRLVSCYVQKVKMKNPFLNFWKYGRKIEVDMSFEKFALLVCDTPDSIADRHFKSQHCFLYSKNQLIVDYIGKLETISEGWEQIAKKFQLPLLKHSNKSDRKKTDNYYTYELAFKVSERYKKDILLFGYSAVVDQFLNELKSKDH